MKHLKRISFIKTLRINLKYFPLKIALKFPIFISRNVFLKRLKGDIIINGVIKTGQIRIGFMDTSLTTGKEMCVLNIEGLIQFTGKAKIGAGSKIAVGKNAKLTLGQSFKITSNSAIACFNEIVFGNDCLLSWDILVMDTDAHSIYDKDKNVINKDKKIVIGNKVWIGCRSSLLKGAGIPDGCIVGANTIITKEYLNKNSLILGNPANEIKSGITW